jgi:hypothetical protein
LRGVFFGDEICCHNVTCWETALAPVATALRGMLGPSAILYTNECANYDITEVPKDLDLISVDVYDGFKAGQSGAEEVVAAKNMYAKVLPKLHAHQQALLVPGTVGCGNQSTGGEIQRDQSDALVSTKLQNYFEWMKVEKRIGGINPWHWNHLAAEHLLRHDARRHGPARGNRRHAQADRRVDRPARVRAYRVACDL